jgi:aspartate aminotransferase
MDDRARRDVAKGINTLQSHVTSNVANVAQLAALEALTGPPQDTVADMREAFDRRRRLAVEPLLEAIEGVEVAVPDGAFYVFPSFEGHLGRTIAGRESRHDAGACRRAARHVGKVALVPGEAFGAPGYARLSYALGDDDLVEGIRRIGEVLAS